MIETAEFIIRLTIVVNGETIASIKKASFERGSLWKKRVRSYARTIKQLLKNT